MDTLAVGEALASLLMADPAVAVTAALCSLVVVALLKHFHKSFLAKPTTDAPPLLSTMLLYVGNLIEAGIYAFFYCFFGVCTAHLVESLFPALNPAAKNWEWLLLEVCLQAGVNAVFAQLVRDLVHSLPIPDIGGDKKKLAAQGGSIIFGFVTLSRQPVWKAKVAHLDKLFGNQFLTFSFLQSP